MRFAATFRREKTHPPVVVMPEAAIAQARLLQDALRRQILRMRDADDARQVQIVEARPLSRDKRWVVENGIKKEIRTADTGVADLANVDVKTEE